MPSDNQKSLLIVDIDYEAAKEWAGLVSLSHDLDSTVQVCERLIGALPSNDRVLIESLWTTALIKYTRCFKSGKRFGLSTSLLDGLNGDPHGAHKYYVDMRNKHLAHSVNPFEQVKIGLVLSDPKIEMKVMGTVQFSQWHISANEDGVVTLKNLCLVLKKKLAETAKEVNERVLSVGRSLDLADLYKRAELKTEAPPPSDAGEPRK